MNFTGVFFVIFINIGLIRFKNTDLAVTEINAHSLTLVLCTCDRKGVSFIGKFKYR